MLVMMGFIIFNVVWNVKKWGLGIDYVLVILLLVIFVSMGVIFGVFVLFGVIKFVLL